MQIFLVGGAVRDELLGQPVHEHDWVVVGATPEAMAAQGFSPVGKDFPVFLHPETKEEYALARTERKTAPGYRGFVVNADPNVTLEQDLGRRDLTINAIAKDDRGKLVDPYGGLRDLKDRQLRHVSAAFAEDPVRILRTARFAARYQHLGFVVAEETLALMRTMVAAGEADHLVPERIWKELSRALLEGRPRVFIETLHTCGALARILPELDQLFGIDQRAEHHPEVDAGEHTLLCLDQVCLLSETLEARFAVMVHDLGKALTPRDLLPRHPGHELRGLDPIRRVCERLAIPNACRDLALLVCEFHLQCHRAPKLPAPTLVAMLERLDAFRRPERLQEFLRCCEADARGRKGYEKIEYPQRAFLKNLVATLAGIQAQPFLEQGLRGPELGQAIHRARVARTEELQNEWRTKT